MPICAGEEDRLVLIVDFVHPQLAGVPAYVVTEAPGSALWVGLLVGSACVACGGRKAVGKGGGNYKKKNAGKDGENEDELQEAVAAGSIIEKQVAELLPK